MLLHLYNHHRTLPNVSKRIKYFLVAVIVSNRVLLRAPDKNGALNRTVLLYRALIINQWN